MGATMDNLMSNVNHILRNRRQFNEKYADVIAKFESVGVEHRMAEAMAITVVAKMKTINDMMK